MALDMKASFTTGEIAELLGVAPRTVAGMIDDGEIKGFPIRSHRRVSRADLISYLRKIRHGQALERIGEALEQSEE